MDRRATITAHDGLVCVRKITRCVQDLSDVWIVGEEPWSFPHRFILTSHQTKHELITTCQITIFLRYERCKHGSFQELADHGCSKRKLKPSDLQSWHAFAQKRKNCFAACEVHEYVGQTFEDSHTISAKTNWEACWISHKVEKWRSIPVFQFWCIPKLVLESFWRKDSIPVLNQMPGLHDDQNDQYGG